MANRRLRVLICQQQKLANCTPDCDTGRERIKPTNSSLSLSLLVCLCKLPTERSAQASGRERQPVNFYSSPKSLLAISVRQGRQQLLVITGSPSLLLSVGERRDGREGENMFQSQCLYLFIYFFTCDVEPQNVYQL